MSWESSANRVLELASLHVGSLRTCIDSGEERLQLESGQKGLQLEPGNFQQNPKEHIDSGLGEGSSWNVVSSQMTRKGSSRKLVSLQIRPLRKWNRKELQLNSSKFTNGMLKDTY